MRLDFQGERVLAVVAHPDDAELLCAGTLARARADGAAIGLCVLCQGDKGQPEPPLTRLAEVRAAELNAATALLGAELFVLGVPDSELAETPATRSGLTAQIRRFQPTLLLAHAACDYHADHRAASALTETCSWLCASRGFALEAPPLSHPPALWWMDTIGMQGFDPALLVDVSAYATLKEQMLGCHVSQLQRGADRDFAPLVDLMRRQMQTRGWQAEVAAAEAFRPHHTFKRSRAW
jgi:LmbE family N-acetylglucosaminyl deacetylase